MWFLPYDKLSFFAKLLYMGERENLEANHNGISEGIVLGTLGMVFKSRTTSHNCGFWPYGFLCFRFSETTSAYPAATEATSGAAAKVTTATVVSEPWVWF